MAPVILALGNEDWVDQVVISSGQHQQMLDPILDFFGIAVDENLSVMRPDQSLAGLSARSIDAMDDAMARHQPDCVIVQGDTTTVAMAALAAFYRNIPVAHVEAGLRTHDMRNPFPEEMNRAHLILTDSGGVQEEAPALAKPVLVLRDTTERPEAVTEGVVELLGTDRARIAARAITLLTDDVAYRAMARGVSPYGDGHAADRIVKRLKTCLL